MKRQHTYSDLVFCGVSGAESEIVTYGAPSSHDPERTNLVSLDTRTGEIHCDCKHAETHPHEAPRCWHAREVEAAWLAHPAMVGVRWLTDDQLVRYGRKLAAMAGGYRARTGRALPADLINLAAARSEWRNRARRAAAIEATAVAA